MTAALAPPFVHSTASDVRARIAEHMQRTHVFEHRVGRVTLRPHQAAVVPRLRKRLLMHGGALLADAVGLGKTFVALAIAQTARSPLVVAPAALREMWRDAAQQAGVTVPAFVSVESLSRRDTIPAMLGATTDATVRTVADATPDLLIVDEAHHLRTRTTRRYAAMRALAARAPVLLLSATPVHNAVRDLAALCALFLGDAALRLPLATLQRHVIRRGPGDLRGTIQLPVVRAPTSLDLPPDDALLGQLIAIPAPVPSADGGTAHALCTLTLVRAWCSSDAALSATLRRRLAMAHALVAALEGGRHPTRHELRAWHYADGALQLALPGLVLAPRTTHPEPRETVTDLAEMLDAVRLHAGALADLLHTLAAPSARDATRARHLFQIGARYAFAPVLAFSHSAHTVRALFRLLRRHQGVGVLTGAGAEIASGRISRTDALGRFARSAGDGAAYRAAYRAAVDDLPELASRATPAVDRDRIWLLLATDVLSEGLNLQHASVVVHLDLPWTAARLEQRVGRVARQGARCDVIDVFAMSPPASGESLLRVEARVRRKLADATTAVGAPSVGPLLWASPEHSITAPARSEVECAERVRTTLADWRACPAHAQPTAPEREWLHRAPIVAAVSAAASGWIACLCEPGASAYLLTCADDRVTTSTCALADALLRASPGSARSARVPHELLAAATKTLAAWWRARAGERLAGARDTARSPAQRHALRRLERIIATAPRHRRASMAGLAAAARSILSRPPSSARDASIVTADVADGVTANAADGADDRWLRAIAALEALVPAITTPATTDCLMARTAALTAAPPVVALLLFDATPAPHHSRPPPVVPALAQP